MNKSIILPAVMALCAFSGYALADPASSTKSDPSAKTFDSNDPTRTVPNPAAGSASGTMSSSGRSSGESGKAGPNDPPPPFTTQKER